MECSRRQDSRSFNWRCPDLHIIEGSNSESFSRGFGDYTHPLRMLRPRGFDLDISEVSVSVDLAEGFPRAHSTSARRTFLRAE